MHMSTAGASSVKTIIERRCDSVLDIPKRVIFGDTDVGRYHRCGGLVAGVYVLSVIAFSTALLSSLAGVQFFG